MLQKSSKEQRECFVSNKIFGEEKRQIRKSVCFQLPTKENLEDNNFYCIFHLPDSNKKDEFTVELAHKLNKKEYCFDWVWFPILELEAQTFDSKVTFRNAFFSGRTSLQKLRFLSDADFSFSVFDKTTHFYDLEFLGRVSFLNCEFEGEITHFSNVKFLFDLGQGLTVFFDNSKFNGEFQFNCKDTCGCFSFHSVEFNKPTTFFKSEFKNEVSFTHTKFLDEVSFSEVEFHKDAVFFWSIFHHDTFFDNTLFHKTARFNSVIFEKDSDILFRHTYFKDYTDFKYVTFSNYWTFEPYEPEKPLPDTQILDFRYARLEKPDKITFIDTPLKPCWFIGIDSRKFNFTNVDWKNVSSDFSKLSVEKELKQLEERNIVNSKQLLKIAYRQLAENAEANSRFEEASKFRQMAFEIEWLEKREKPKQFNILYNIYRYSSRFGESSSRAFLILLFIILISTVLYLSPFCKFGKEQRKLDLVEAIPYSIRVMLLQRPEPQPENDFAKWIVTFESIVGPLQAALLALAIRRKFMR
jgi:hypothetical protein